MCFDLSMDWLIKRCSVCTKLAPLWIDGEETGKGQPTKGSGGRVLNSISGVRPSSFGALWTWETRGDFTGQKGHWSIRTVSGLWLWLELVIGLGTETSCIFGYGSLWLPSGLEPDQIRTSTTSDYSEWPVIENASGATFSKLLRKLFGIFLFSEKSAHFRNFFRKQLRKIFLWRYCIVKTSLERSLEKFGKYM